MEKINWSKLASKDLEKIYEFIAMDSLHYAEKTIESILDRIRQIEQLPESGRVVPEYSDPRLRELIEGNYRIVYRLKNKAIYIVRIHHSARMLRLRRP